jgi:hypothetical protein
MYSVPELAELCGMTRQALHRLLVRQDVRVLRVGRVVLVPLSGFRDAFPEIWSAIVLARGFTGSETIECPACGTKIKTGA